MNNKNMFSWILRLVVAIILLQTLYYKFTAHPDSVHIFTAIGIEPWGRIGVGILELITALLILIPNTKVIGIMCSLVIILGAVFSHLLVLGLNVSNDGGALFVLAIIVLIASILFIKINKNEVLLTIKPYRK
jgi:hypothetical protein